MRANVLIWIIVALLFCALPAFAVTIEKPLPDAVQEQRAEGIFNQLRCVVCAGESLADSDTELAKQMRAHVRDMVKDGKSNTEVLEYFTEQYGPSVRMAPEAAGNTLIIWLTPVFLLCAGGYGIYRYTLRRA